MIQMDAKNNMTDAPVVVICIHMSAMSYGTGTLSCYSLLKQ